MDTSFLKIEPIGSDLSPFGGPVVGSQAVARDSTNQAIADPASPETYTNAVNQSEKSGIPANLIAGDDDAKMQAQASAIQWPKLQARTPQLVKWLQPPINARAAYDDIDALMAYGEQQSYISNSMDIGRAQHAIVKATADAREQRRKLTPAEKESVWDQQAIIAEKRRYLDADERYGSNTMAGAVADFGEYVAGVVAEQLPMKVSHLPEIGKDVVKGATAGGVVGAGAGGIGAMPGAAAGATVGMISGVVRTTWQEEAGSLYTDLLEDGVSPDDAWFASEVYGGIAGTLEAVVIPGGSQLMAPLKMAAKKYGRDAMKFATANVALKVAKEGARRGIDVAQGIGINVLGESVTEGLQAFSELVTKEIYTTYGADDNALFKAASDVAYGDTEGAYEAIYESMKKGAAAALGFASVGASVQVTFEARAWNQAMREVELLNALPELADATKTAKRSKSVFKDAVRAMGEGQSADTVYVDIERLDSLSQEGGEQLAQTLGFAEEYAKAKAEGSDSVAISMADKMTDIALNKDVNYQAFTDISRVDKDGFSPATAREMYAEALTRAQDIAAESAPADSQQFDDRIADLEDQLVLTGMDRKQASDNMKLFSSIVARRAADRGDGTTPFQEISKYDLGINSGGGQQDQDGLSYNQDGELNRDENFARWSGGADVVELGDARDFQSGEPVVIEALHGTTHDITAFTTERANYESDLGAGIYMSNSEADVAENYAGTGPDLTQRIELRAKQLFDEISEDPESFGLDEDTEVTEDMAEAHARKELHGEAPNTMPLYAVMHNPLVVSDYSGQTFFDYKEEYNEELDEYGEPEGLLVDFIEAFRDVSEEFEDINIDDAVGEIDEHAVDNEGISAKDLIKLLKESDAVMYAADYENQRDMIAGEVIRQTFEAMGYDGIIDQTVGDKFAHMEGINPDTVHFIAFNPTQVKSAIGNRGTFDPNDANILHQGARRSSPAANMLRKGVKSLKGSDGKAPTVGDVAQRLLDDMRHAYPEGLDIDNPDDVRTAVNIAATEARHQLELSESGGDWYNVDIGKAMQWTAQSVPRLMESKALRVLLAVIAAPTSYNLKAHLNWHNAARIIQHYEKTKQATGRGELLTMNPDSGKSWTTRPATKQQLELLQSLIDQKGETGAAVWLVSDHPISELAEVRRDSGVYFDGDQDRALVNYRPSGVVGKMTDMKAGTFILGPKGGPFALNVNGIAETTGDKWFARTIGRYFGNLLDPARIDKAEKTLGAPTEKERKVMRIIAREVGKRLNVEEHDAQAILWFFEQSLYSSLGVGTGARKFSEGAQRFLEHQGIEPGAIESGWVHSGAEIRADAAEARAGARGSEAEAGDALNQAADKEQPRGRMRLGGNWQRNEAGEILVGTAPMAETRTLIQRLSGADASTFMHESAHYFLELDFFEIRNGTASQATIDRIDTIMKWTGVDSIDDFHVDQHEQFARGFEAYLREGKAPTKELEGIFAKFRELLMVLYRNVTSLRVNLTDDVREVMGAMFEATVAVDNTRTARSNHETVQALIDAALLPAEDIAKLTATMEAARNQAIGEIEDNLLKQAERDVRRDRGKVRSQVRKELTGSRWNIATRWLRDGTKIGEDHPMEGVEHSKMNIDKLRARFGTPPVIVRPNDVTDERLDQMQEVFDTEGGWAEEGGKLITQMDARVDERSYERTKWTALGSGWWADKPEGTSQEVFQKALDNARAGKRLGVRQMEAFQMLWELTDPDGIMMSDEQRYYLEREQMNEDAWNLESEEMLDDLGDLTVDDAPYDDADILFQEATDGDVKPERDGDEILRMLPRGVANKKGIANEDEIAIAFGYESAIDMLRDMADNPSMNVAVAKRMDAIYANNPEADAIKARADELMQTEKEGRLLRQELAAIAELAAKDMRPEAERQAAAAGAPTIAEARQAVVAAEDALKEAMEAPVVDMQAVVAAQAELSAAREVEAAVKPHRRAVSHAVTRAARMKREAGKPISFVRAHAARILNEMTIGEMRSSVAKFSRMQIRYSQAAIDAIARRDWDTAMEMKEREILNHELHAGAIRLRDKVIKDQKRLSKYTKLKTESESKNLVKLIGPEHVEQIRKLLGAVRFGPLKPGPKAAHDELTRWIHQERETGDLALLNPAEDLGLLSSSITHYTKMTNGDWEALVDTIKNIETAGRKKTLIDLAAGEMNFEEFVDAAIAQDSIGATGRKFSADNPPLSKFSVRAWDAQILKVESMIIALDGGRPGMLHDAVFAPIARAQSEREKREIDLNTKLNAIFTKRLTGDLRGSLNDKVHITDDFQPTRQMLISIALNAGNESNLDKMMRGAHPNNGGPWDETFVMEMINRLTRKEMDLVQDVWDLVNSLWPEIVKLERSTSGVAPPKIQARVLHTRHGDYKGGYYPVIYDPEGSMTGSIIEGQNIEEMGNKGYGSAATSHGFTKERTKVAKPIRLSLEYIPQHIAQVLLDLTHREAVQQANKVLMNPKIFSMIHERLGREYYQVMSGWLKDVASDGNEKMLATEPFSRLAKTARINFSMMTLGYKMMTTMLGIASAPILMKRAGPVGYLREFSRFVGNMALNPAGALHGYGAFEKSAALKARIANYDREVREGLEYDLRHNTVFKRNPGARVALSTHRAVRHYAWHAMIMVDYFMVIPAWKASYSREIAKGTPEQQAIDIADSDVRLTAGEGGVKDLSAFQRSGEFMAAMTPFFSYMSVQYSAIRMEQRKARHEAQQGKMTRAMMTEFSAVTMLMILPVLMETALREVLGGGQECDWDNDCLAKLTAANMMAYPFETVPFVRDAASIAKNKIMDRPNFGKSTPVTMLINTATGAPDAATEMVEGEFDKGTMRIIRDAIGLGLGWPTGQANVTGTHLYEVLYGGEDLDINQLLFQKERAR